MKVTSGKAYLWCIPVHEKKRQDKKDMHHQYHHFSSRFIFQLVMDHRRFAKSQSTSFADLQKQIQHNIIWTPQREFSKHKQI